MPTSEKAKPEVDEVPSANALQAILAKNPVMSLALVMMLGGGGGTLLNNLTGVQQLREDLAAMKADLRAERREHQDELKDLARKVDDLQADIDAMKRSLKQLSLAGSAGLLVSGAPECPGDEPL